MSAQKHLPPRYKQAIFKVYLLHPDKPIDFFADIFNVSHTTVAKTISKGLKKKL